MSRERAAQLIDAGIWLKLSGDVEGARRLFERALKLDPENEKARELLAPPTIPEPRHPTIPPSENPFEPPPGDSGEWPTQAVFEVPLMRSPPAPPPVPSAPIDLNEDWGRATGSAPSPVPQVPPVTPTIRTGRTAMMFSESGLNSLPSPPSPRPFADPQAQPKRSMLPLASSPSQSAPARQTMAFAGSAPPSPLPVKPSTLVFASEPSRTTLNFGGNTPPRNTIPFDLAAPSRSTIPFATTAPAPSPHTDVQPVVVRLEEFDETPEDTEDPFVEMLRQQVDGARAGSRPWAPPSGGSTPPPPPSAPDPLFPSTIVLVDRTPEPSPPRATPPMFEDSGNSGVRVQQVTASPPSGQDAWNWSAGSPPPTYDMRTDSPRPSPLVPQASSAWDQRSNPGIKMDDIVVPDRTMELVSSHSKVTRSPESKREEISMLLRGARDLIDLDDHTGAMELIEKAQGVAPDDPEVQQLRERSERTLLAMFESKLGHLDKIPRVMLKDDEIIWLNLDHRAGFVLAQIDGSMTFEDLFAVSGMSRIDTARILAQLVDEGVISRA